MARHIRHRCAFKALDPTETRAADDGGYLRGLTYCGGTSYFQPIEREKGAARRASCPKCAAALGRLNLAKHGERVRLEPAPELIAKRFKSAWSFYLDGTLRGYVVAEHGFGKGWELLGLPRPGQSYDLQRGHSGYVTPEREVNSWNCDKVPPERPIQPLHFSARDAMACGAVRAAAAGLLPTAEERADEERRESERKRADAAAREAARVKFEADEARRKDERTERRETALAGLEQLSQLPELSNLERAGLEAALTIVRSYT